MIGCGVGYTLVPAHESWPSTTGESPPIRACFSPNGRCTNLIVSSIDNAKKSIDVMAYSFTSQPIAEALVTAHKRGVNVQILIDKSQLKEKYSQLNYLGQNGLSLFIDSAQGIAHNKVMIFDDRFVLTGSFNFSKAAESRNAENIVIIDDPVLANIYLKNWEGRRETARLYLDTE